MFRAWMIAEPTATAPCLGGYATRRHGVAGRILITIKADVVDARFAGLDTIYYFLKARVC